MILGHRRLHRVINMLPCLLIHATCTCQSDVCDIDSASFSQNLLQVETTLSRHEDAALAKLPERMSQVVITEPNPEPCGLRFSDLGPGAMRQIASGNCSSCSHNGAACSPECQAVGDCHPHFERVKLMSVDVPDVTAGKALVRVAYSSVNPCDYKTATDNDDVPITNLGLDFAGIVEKSAPDCSFKPGDRVWGNKGGSYATFVLANCDHTGLAPSSLSLKEASVMPVVSATGQAAFKWSGAPWSYKPVVLVLGGTGGTGIAGIQLAKSYGAGKVITTCSERNFGLVKSLGADQAIDYHTENWWEVLGPGSVDIIYDCVAEWGTGDHAYAILKDGGKFMTTLVSSMASPGVVAKRPSVQQLVNQFSALPSEVTSELNYLKQLADSGQYRMPVYKTFDISHVADAFEEGMQGHTVGKIAIKVA